MSDRLEDFVKQHREQFDLHEPDPSIWLKVSTGKAPVVTERRPLHWLRIAAAIAMIFAGSTAGIYYLTGNKAETDQYGSELYMEIRETEAYYTHMVSQRYEELRPYLASDPAASKADGLARHPVGRWGQPEDIAAAAVWLGSDQSTFTTGQSITVDGGLVAASPLQPGLF